MKYTELPTDCFDALATNAGIILFDFDPKTGEFSRDNILGATSGGVNVSCVPTYSDWGEDVDSAPKNTKELKHLDSWECKMSGTLISFTDEALGAIIGAYISSGEKFTPNKDLSLLDFTELWYVCDYGKVDGGFIAIKLIDALSTGGFTMQSTNNGKGQFAFEFTGHSSTENIDTVPMEFYLHKAESEVSPQSGE